MFGDNTQCYTNMNCNDTYMEVKYIHKTKKMKWTSSHLKAISLGYITALKKLRTRILNGKLGIYKTILANNWYVTLIIVP